MNNVLYQPVASTMKELATTVKLFINFMNIVKHSGLYKVYTGMHTINCMYT